VSEAAVYVTLLWSWFAIAAVTVVALFFLSAPYGRHARAGWGPTVSARLAWFVMEAPAALTIAACFALRPPTSPTAWVMLALWETHYLNRALIFPLRMRAGGKPMPLALAAMGATFNLVNGYLNGRWLTWFGHYDAAWLTDPRFLGGAAVMLIGLAINLQADAILRALRKPGETHYAIPSGGLYSLISCPNYFGEVVEWTGWAILTWSIAGTSFAVWTAANLVPRAWTHHRWYRAQFPDYPAGRRAIFPFLL
jgi:protein-S-isoprenylcysteine O-methyltransferase Ste14